MMNDATLAEALGAAVDLDPEISDLEAAITERLPVADHDLVLFDYRTRIVAVVADTLERWQGSGSR